MNDVDIQKQIGDLALKVSDGKAEILSRVSEMLEKALRRTQENIAQSFQIKMAEAIAVAIREFKSDNDSKYAPIWVEKWIRKVQRNLRWLLLSIGVIAIGWFSGIFKFIVELYFKTKQ